MNVQKVMVRMMQKPLPFFLALGLGSLGLAISLRPGYHLIRQQVLQYQAKTIWQNFKVADRTSLPNDPVAWIRAPDSGLNTLVLLNVNQVNLRKFPAWSIHAAAPGTDGLGMIFGHRDAHFRRLAALKLGEPILIEGVHWRKNYVVKQIEVLPKEALANRLVRASQIKNAVVLVTCYPFRYAGPAPERYLVWLESE